MCSTLSDSHPNSLLTVYPNPADCITTSGRGYAAGAVPTFNGQPSLASGVTSSSWRGPSGHQRAVTPAAHLSSVPGEAGHAVAEDAGVWAGAGTGTGSGVPRPFSHSLLKSGPGPLRTRRGQIFPFTTLVSGGATACAKTGCCRSCGTSITSSCSRNLTPCCLCDLRARQNHAESWVVDGVHAVSPVAVGGCAAMTARTWASIAWSWARFGVGGLPSCSYSVRYWWRRTVFRLSGQRHPPMCGRVARPVRERASKQTFGAVVGLNSWGGKGVANSDQPRAACGHTRVVLPLSFEVPLVITTHQVRTCCKYAKPQRCARRRPSRARLSERRPRTHVRLTG